MYPVHAVPVGHSMHVLFDNIVNMDTTTALTPRFVHIAWNLPTSHKL